LGDNEQLANNFSMRDWAKDKKPVWERVVAKYGGSPQAFDWGTWDFVEWGLGKAWSTISSVGKARKFGWQRSDDSFEIYVQTFRAFENAGVLPSVPVADDGRLTVSATQNGDRAVNPRDAVLSRLKKAGMAGVLKSTESNILINGESDLPQMVGATDVAKPHERIGYENGIAQCA
jgi:hypothetical protein